MQALPQRLSGQRKQGLVLLIAHAVHVLAKNVTAWTFKDRTKGSTVLGLDHVPARRFKLTPPLGYPDTRHYAIQRLTI